MRSNGSEWGRTPMARVLLPVAVVGLAVVALAVTAVWILAPSTWEDAPEARANSVGQLRDVSADGGLTFGVVGDTETGGEEQALFHLVNGEWTTPLLDRVMPLMSKIGNLGAVWFVVLVALAAFGKTTGRKAALAGLAAFAIGFAGAEVLKEVALRPRPFAVLPDARLLIPEPRSFAFPSGHTASSFAAASGAVLAARKLLGRVPPWG